MLPLVPLDIMATNGGSSRSAVEQLLHAIGKRAVVIGRDVAGAGARRRSAASSSPTGPAVGRRPVGPTQHAHFRIGRPGRLDQLGTRGRRIHPHVVGPAEGIHQWHVVFICQRRLKTCVASRPTPQPILRRRQVVRGAANAVGRSGRRETRSRQGRARSEKRRPPSAPSARAWPRSACGRAECRCGRAPGAWPGSAPSRGSMQLSQTTIASLIGPSSSTRQRACSSSWMWVAVRSCMPPFSETPSGGVILLVAAPRNCLSMATLHWAALPVSHDVSARMRAAFTR